MKQRFQKITLTVVAIGALAFGGATFANAVSSPSQSQDKSATVRNSATDKSSAQEQESAAEQESANDKADSDNVQDENGPDKPDTAGENAQENEQAGQENEQAGSEVPNDDGPGGHADEPGNPNADHQFQGQE